MRRVVFVLALLLAAHLYASVAVVIEMPDNDARPVFVANVVDGDTVELSDGRRVRPVGYDAYELSEPLGALARQELRSLCLGEAYLDVDDLEPQDRYGRVLGYLW
jgi:endonuclease YncB( thermonuclease family)